MTIQEKLVQIGATTAPLPPLVAQDQDSFHGQDDTSLQSYIDSYHTYGPIFRVQHSDKLVTVLAGPEANVFVARYSSELLSERSFWEEFDQEYTGNTGPSLRREGEANRQRRAFVSRSYSRGRILDRLPYLLELVQERTQDWQAGQSLHLFPWLQPLVAEQLGQLLTHYSPGDYVPDLETFLSTALSATVLKSQAKDVLQSPAYLHAKARIFELGRAIVAAHRAHPSQPPDAVDDLIMASAGRAVPDEQLALGALGPFLAGLHTVTTAACFLLYALLKHPQLLERVVAEVDVILSQGQLTWDKLKTMQVLHGASMEALRLYPISIGHHLHALQPFAFAGYRVEPGQDVFAAMTVSHFLPELFPDPLTFDIDRYHDPRHEHRQRGAYAPFGLGDHNCLGAGIAEVQLVVTIAALLHHYEVALDPPDYEIHPLDASRFSVRDQFQLKVIAQRH